MKVHALRAQFVVVAVLALFYVLPASADLVVKGGGETLITAGNGGVTLGTLLPVKTTFGFRATRSSEGTVEGRFECLALMPGAAGGPGSGQFDQNVMYVSGTVTTLQRLDRNTAIMTGTARCTGLGVGEGIGFQATVTKGGPGARIYLTVDTLPGFAFDEVVTSGAIEIR